MAAATLNPTRTTSMTSLTSALACAVLAALACLISGCDEKPPEPGLEKVVVKGHTFWVEPALDDPTRIRGLGHRDRLPDDRGMLFVFPASQIHDFIMRDCKFDIDIAFLDDVGRVVSIHTMKLEPRNPGESDIDYEMRLTRYSSRFPARMALEVNGGTFERIGLKPQDVIELDAQGLKRRAR